MKILIKGAIFAAGLFLAASCARASAAEAIQDTVLLSSDRFERDYIQELYNSDEGLDGSSVNCVFSDTEGIIWVGSYSGLYSYDSTEFHKYTMADHTVAVRCITQDRDGCLWFGTNGDGLYRYDGNEFTAVPMENDAPLMLTVYDIVLDDNGVLWAASGGGLLTADSTEEDPKADLVEPLGSAAVRDLALLPDGTVVCVSRTGIVTKYTDGRSTVITPGNLEDGEKVRCVDVMDSEHLSLGTDGNTILETDLSGNILQSARSEEIASINEIYRIDRDSAWVCADNGIAVLQDGVITPLNLKIDNSVEMVCEDYQGNYWFASSWTGLLHLYENYFSDLGSYLGINKAVNCVVVHRGMLYIGTDSGLLCYDQKTPMTSELIRRCEGVRVRQILVDEQDNLWIATTRHGLLRQSEDGSIEVFTTENLNLTTNDLRCLYRGQEGILYIGTESGLFAMTADGDIEPVVESEDSVLSTERILCMQEDSDGTLFVGMDGAGLYMVRDGKIVDHKTTEDGLVSNIIMKIREDETDGGLWTVSGAGISHISREGTIQNVTGIPAANCLDLIHIGNGDTAILAGNGFFRLQETELLKEEPKYQFYDKERGFAVDATSNANHCISDGTLYVCGTDGMAALDLSRSVPQREIRTYIYAVEADGCRPQELDGVFQLDRDTYRLNLDVRLLNYCHDAYLVNFYLDGMDQEVTSVPSDSVNAVSYTNLKGKTYQYRFQVANADSGEVMAEKQISIRKEEEFWEENSNRITLIILLLIVVTAVVYAALRWREKSMEIDIRNKVSREKQREMERAAYRDLVTGAYNRNIYELDKEQHPITEIKALVVVGINNAEYLHKRKGTIYVEDLLRAVARILRTYAGSSERIYRISYYIFCIPFKKEIDLENFTQNMKQAFALHLVQIDEDSTGLSVGAVYNDPFVENTYRSLFDRCDTMRRMDQKHEEDRFIRSKIAEVEQAMKEEK